MGVPAWGKASGVGCLVERQKELTAVRHAQRVGRDGGKGEKAFFDMFGNIVILK